MEKDESKQHYQQHKIGAVEGVTKIKLRLHHLLKTFRIQCTIEKISVKVPNENTPVLTWDFRTGPSPVGPKIYRSSIFNLLSSPRHLPKSEEQKNTH